MDLPQQVNIFSVGGINQTYVGLGFRPKPTLNSNNNIRVNTMALFLLYFGILFSIFILKHKTEKNNPVLYAKVSNIFFGNRNKKYLFFSCYVALVVVLFWLFV